MIGRTLVLVFTQVEKDSKVFFRFHYEQQINRDLKRIHISGCRCNERLKTKTDGSKSLTNTGLCEDLEHLTLVTRLIGESFECDW